MLKKTLVLALVCTLFLISASWAYAPPFIKFSGRLTDPVTGKATEGPVNLTFAFYLSEAGGSPYWSEVHSGQNLINGIFDLDLGSVNAMPDELFSENANVWLEVKVGDDPPLIPRQFIVSVPYALVAKHLREGTVMAYGNPAVKAISDAPGGRGVYGRASQNSGAGVYGSGITTGFGVWGKAGTGVVGEGEYVGVAGKAPGWAVYGETDANDGYAGYFKGGRGVYIENNLGIGVEEPTARLEIGGTPGVDGIKFPDGSLQTKASGAVWEESGGNVFRPTGKVGIGTMNPAQVLDVRGDATFGNKVGIGTVTPSQTLDVRGNVYVANNIGIGTVDPTEKLDVQGNAYVSNSAGIGTRVSTLARLEVQGVPGAAGQSSASIGHVVAGIVAKGPDTGTGIHAFTGDFSGRDPSAWPIGHGLIGEVSKPGSGKAGVYGMNLSDGPGVQGYSATGHSIYGQKLLTGDNAAVYGKNDAIWGLSGIPDNPAVKGESSFGYGVYGISNSSGPNGRAGVYGKNTYTGISDGGPGVLGTSSGIGVKGVSTTRYGVYGETSSSGPLNPQAAVYGHNVAATQGGPGVHGYSESGPGVKAESGSGPALEVGNGAIKISSVTANATAYANNQVVTANAVVGTINCMIPRAPSTMTPYTKMIVINNNKVTPNSQIFVTIFGDAQGSATSISGKAWVKDPAGGRFQVVLYNSATFNRNAYINFLVIN